MRTATPWEAMTTLLPSRRDRATDGRPPGPAAPPSPLTTSALGAAARAAALGLLSVGVLVVLTWAAAADSGSSAAQAVRGAAQLFVFSHHVPVAVPGGTLGLTPLGLLVLPVALLVGGGRRAVRHSRPVGRREHLQLLGIFTATYTALLFALSLAGRTDQIAPSVPLTLVVGAALAAAAGGWGMARESGAVEAAADRLPTGVRAAASGALAGLGILLACGALLLALTVLAHSERIALLDRAVEPGALGTLALLLLCLLLVPNAVLAAAAVAVGPGFAVGDGTSVTAFTADLGAVPAVPLLGALPTDGPLPAPLLLVFAGPLLAGALAAVVTLRRRERAGGPDLGPVAGPLHCAAAGAAAGLALGLLTALGGGPVGGGRLSAVGASPWQVALATAAALATVAAATAWVLARRTATTDESDGPHGPQGADDGPAAGITTTVRVRTAAVVRAVRRLAPRRTDAAATPDADPPPSTPAGPA